MTKRHGHPNLLLFLHPLPRFDGLMFRQYFVSRSASIQNLIPNLSGFVRHVLRKATSAFRREKLFINSQ